VFLGLVDKTFRPTYPLSILAHQLRRRFPSDRSLLRGALAPTRLRLPKVRLSFVARPVLGPKPSVKAVRCSAALLGVTALASRFAHQVPRDPGAASRERRFPLPAPSSRLAPGRTRKSIPLPAGGDRFFCPFLVLRAVAGLPERLGRPPRSLEHHAPPDRVAKVKFSVRSLWITGILGTTEGTFS
jgi:hypothetical protein